MCMCLCECVCVNVCVCMCMCAHVQKPEEGIGSLGAEVTSICRMSAWYVGPGAQTHMIVKQMLLSTASSL